LENLSIHKGSVVHIREVVDGLRKRGHQVGVIGSSFRQPEEILPFYNLNIKFFFLRSLGIKKQPYILLSIILFFYLIKILPQYNIIYARDFHTVLIALFPRLLFHKKLIFEINGIAHEEQGLKGKSIFNKILVLALREGERLATKYSDKIVSVTPQIASYLIKRYHCQSNKIEIVTNGVNLKKFRPIEDEAKLKTLREKLEISMDESIILFVGNLNLTQGVEDLIQVAPSVIREIKQIKFLIVGDGILKEELKREVKRLGISNYFIFTGMVDYEDVPLYINLSDICVLLKRKLNSGWAPIKLFEYLACGKPVISSRVEGLEFIEEKKVGKLTEPKSLKSLQEGLLYLLKRPQERVEMGRKGLQLIQKSFDWGTKVDEIEKIIKNLA
jgi:glycosyltransferase involved in cell wall biosynthesis